MRCRILLLPLLSAVLAAAHPMGNFSVSHYTRIETSGSGVRVQYALDLAELPSFELLQKWGLKQNAAPAELEAHAAREMREWAAAGLHFKSNGAAVPGRVVSTHLKVSEGAGALPVFHVTATLAVDAKPGVLEFEDTNFPERAGWKEIVIAAGANVVKASHGAEEKSMGLTAYPADPAAAPPQDLRGRIEWTGLPAATTAAAPIPQPKIERVPQPVSSAPAPSTSPAAQQKAPGEVTKGDALSQLVSQKDLSLSAVLIALALAFGFGCAHAMTPGHGKTMVAAYLVGERGTPAHALLLGLTTTFTHTISVFALGIAMYFLAGTFAPEKVTRILEFVSGMSIAILGCWLVYQRAMKMRGVDGHHHHHHGHSHSHSHSHSHGAAAGGHHHMPEGEATIGSILALGASGGLVPCPSALVLLLSSIALGRVGLGLILLVAFSTGLASVLVGIGLTVLYAKHLLPASAASSDNAFFRLVPVLSACVIVVVGLVLTGVSLGIVKSGI